MRVAYFSKRKRRTGTPAAIDRALRRAGHEVLAVHGSRKARGLGARLSALATRRALRRFGADLVLIHNLDIQVEAFEAVCGGARTVMFLDDCWPSPVRPEQLGLASRVDLLLTVAEGQIGEFQRAGVRNVAWIAESHDPAVHHPVSEPGPEWRSDVAFIGRVSQSDRHHATRRELIGAVAPGFDLALYGRGWDELGYEPRRRDVFPEHYRLVCAGAGIVLGRDWRDDCARYCSNRTWLTLGCGGFLLTNYAPGFEDLFANHGHLVWYRSTGECLELIEHYLARPEERRRIAEAGHRYARENRTVDHFVRDVLDRVAGRPPAFPPAGSGVASEAGRGAGTLETRRAGGIVEG
ncbi:MAG: CgeB family protein [Myxococcota bacterium]